MKILIDDDKFIRLSWSLKAKSKGEEIRCFESVESFLSSSSEFPKKTPIYLDSNLGNGEKGEVSAKTIYEIGFENIILTTGYSDLNLNDYPWISFLKDKSYPDES